MKIIRFLPRLSPLLALVAVGIYGIETYIGSDWAIFIRDASLFSLDASRKVDAKASIGNSPSNLQKLIHAFKQTFIFSNTSSRKVEAKASSSDNSGSLQRLIARRLHCDKSTSELLNSQKTKPRLSIWFSPYRQFPEVLPEGDQRGKGDYEYFSYMINTKCSGIASNYGAFKGSPADRVFKEASDQGLRQEIILSKKLGYNLFILDLKKAWLSESDADLCRKNYISCEETSDGFLVIDLKVFDRLAKQSDFLRHSLRMGEGLLLAESLEANSLSPVRSGHWYDWEYSSLSSALRWSNGMQGKSLKTDALTPLAGENIPSNLQISLVANPSLKKVLVEAICTRGHQPTITMATDGSSDITKDFDMCMPKSLRTIITSAYNDDPKMQQAPLLIDRDQIRSYFGIKYSLKDATR